MAALPRQNVFNLDAKLIELLMALEGVTELEALDRLGRVNGQVRKLLNQGMQAAARRQVPYPYRWADESLETDLIFAGRDIEQHGAIREALQQLHDRQLEHLCGFLMQIYGADADQQAVTRRHGDGGVDFVALLPPRDSEGVPRVLAGPWRIVGQAKRGAGEIGDVADFCLRVADSRSGTGRHWNLLPEWFRASDAPVLGLFVALGGFGGRLLDDARTHTIVLLSGDQLAADLQQVPQHIDWFDSEGDFDPAKFSATFPLT